MPAATRTSILVVDDDDHFRETLVDAMALDDAEVHGATTCGEAMTCLRTGRAPSIILLDVQLPDMHGFDFCRMLKRSSRYRDIPVVLLSARYTEPADRVEGLLTGAAAYLSKPISLDALLEEMRYHLDRGA
jgi:DNA-binding response OmpR family regulator